MTNDINYICARWRDAVNDPPYATWHGLAKNDEHMWISGGPERRFQPRDQWLDVTDIPAIPRKQVQAAVDEIDGPCGGDGAVMIDNITCPFCGKPLRFDYEIGVEMTQHEGNFRAYATCCGVYLSGAPEEGGWASEEEDEESAVKRFAKNMEAIRKAMKAQTT